MSVSRREQLRTMLADSRQALLVCPQPPLSAFEDALDRWAMESCLFRDRCYGGVVALHNDYARWCVKKAGEVPCSLLLFSEWLITQGFSVGGGGLVYGLLLRIDYEAMASRV